MVLRLCCSLTVLVGCQFDEGGPTLTGEDRADANTIAAIIDARPVESASDAMPIDATASCVDDDNDSFAVVNVAGASCEAPLDCDDTDARAHPGQVDYFDVATPAGRFDFDCDGLETALDTREGFTCGSEWWECKGTGWLNGVPQCGEVGTYHWCEDNNGACIEASRAQPRMPCR